MNTKHILLGVIASVAMASGLTSCDDYLNTDKYFYNQTSLDSVFQRKSLLMQYLNSASSYIPADDQLWTNSYNPFSFASDEAFCAWKDGRHAGIYYAMGEIDKYSGYFDNWANYYKGIRQAYMILENMNKCHDLSETERRDVAGQCNFLLAHYYYSLVRQYGPVPLIPSTIPSNASVDAMSYPRATYDECIDFICKRYEEAASMLDSERASVETYRVPTSGAALAMESRVLLEAASPWFNGNKYYVDFKRSSDGVNYFNQEYDAQKWAKAAAVCKRIIDTGKYALYTVPADSKTPEFPDNVSKANYPDGVGGIDPFRSYNDMFTGEESAFNISEIMWSKGETGDLVWISFPAVAGGGNGLCVSQNLVDAYRMQNGKDINDEGSGYPTADEAWKPIGGNGKSFSNYQLSSQAAKMYDNREMRFYASIVFNYCYREASSYTGTAANNKNFYQTFYKDSPFAAWSDYPNDKSWSGYNCIKYCHPSDKPGSGGTTRSKYFPIIRYAEVLLNYVEAMNEMEGTYTDDVHNVTVSRNTAEMVKYFNMIRYRAGLPGITEADAADKAKMRELIKRERQVEFALEGRRFYDLRRWGDLASTMASPFIVMNVDARSNEQQKFYTRTVSSYQYSLYNITNKMCLYPIKQTYLDKNAKLDQNPGWEK